jgi:peroxiredoxin
MYRFILLALLLSSTNIFAQRRFNYEVKGHIKHFKPGEKVYFQHKGLYKQYIDSVILFNGNFTFKGETIIDNEPEMNNIESRSWLYVDHSGLGINFYNDNTRAHADQATIYLEPGTTYFSTIDSARKATITPPKLNPGYYALDSIYDSDFKNQDSIFKAAKKLQLNRRESLSYELERRDIHQLEQKWELWQFVKNYPSSPVSLYILKHYTDPYPDYDKIEPYFAPLAADLKNTNFGKEYGKMLDTLKLTRIGADAPDFTMNDQYGKPVSLSSYKGKYVLLAFWGSWNTASVKQNLYITNTLKLYGDKNFTVVSVYLDNKKDKWLKAINDEQLIWTQLSDLHVWYSPVAKIYSVKTLPQNFLIDPNGKIIAKDLFYDDLPIAVRNLFEPPKKIIIEN